MFVVHAQCSHNINIFVMWCLSLTVNFMFTHRVMSVLLVFILSTASLVSGDLAPPSLWCANEHISQQWGVQSACQSYDKQSYDHKINITLLYESLCPGCHMFITSVLTKIHQQFSDAVNLQFIPYGNARTQGTAITCQHGPKECVGNKITSCALHFLNGDNSQFKFIQCFEKLYFIDHADPAGVLSKCTAQAGGSAQIATKIKKCYEGDLGHTLQLEAGRQTEAVKPEQHLAVPWILINNVSLSDAQIYMDYLPLVICQFYNSQHKPEGCSQMQNTQVSTRKLGSL